MRSYATYKVKLRHCPKPAGKGVPSGHKLFLVRTTSVSPFLAFWFIFVFLFLASLAFIKLD